MNDFRAKFTRWYYRKGYRMFYVPCDYGDGVGSMSFVCPWWVRILAGWFFSPSVYYRESESALADIVERRIHELKNDESILD